MDWHEYGGYKIPVLTSKSARPAYNISDEEIDKLRNETLFTDDGECMEPGGFRGSPFENRFAYLDDQECRERAEFLEREEASVLHLFRDAGVPVKNQNGLGYCLLGDALIRMADGTDKPIREVRVWDTVFTAEGNLGTVKQLHARQHEGELANVRLWGHTHLRLTPNHSVLTERGYVEAGDLEAGDWVRIPRVTPVNCRVLQTSQHVAKVKAYAGGGRTDETWNNHSVKELPDLIELTHGMGRLVGLYAAEGFSGGPHEVCWAFNINERETLAEEVLTLLRDELGESGNCCENKANGCVVTLCGKQWVAFFKSLCGQYSHAKSFHADVMSGPDEFLEGVLSGWLDGDGSRRRGGLIGATVSKSLAANMFSIANRLGRLPSVVREKPQRNKYAKKRRHVWKVFIPDSDKGSYRAKQDDAALWRKVRSVELEPYSGPVFNIGVEGDNSYIAEGVGVHNCWGYGACSAVEASRLVEGQPYIELSPDSVCAPVKRGRNQGGWASEWLKYAQDHGVAKQSTWRLHDTNYKRYDTPEVNNERRQFVPEEWVDVPSGDMGALRSLLASNRACGMGLMWWGHLVMFGMVAWSDKHGWLYGFRNSHGKGFGLDGWCFCTESVAKHGGGSTVYTVGAE